MTEKRGKGRPKLAVGILKVSILAGYKDKRPLAELAYKHGVSVSTINRVIREAKKEGLL